MKAFPLPFLVLFICCSTLSGLAQGRESVCHEHPKLLKDDKGKPVRLGYKQLKERATNCETVKLPGMVDANGQVLVQILVGPSGAVECATAISGHPLTRSHAQDTARRWTFNPLARKGEKVAFIGILVMYVSWNYDEAREKQCGKE
ncbi:MAG: energy transducer TonB [Acidobacteria bacterium]|nr:energy transducer TonB [Acidobacteriota bacterium]